MLKISVVYVDKQKSFIPEKEYDLSQMVSDEEDVNRKELQLSFMNFSIFEKDPSVAHELFPKII